MRAFYYTLLAITPLTASAADRCQLSELPSKFGQWRYQARRERCEGNLQVEVATGGTVDVGSISIGNSSLPRGEVDLTWDAPPGSESDVGVLATPLSNFRYYQMDARFGSSIRSWLWPGDVRAALGYGDDEIGVFAYTTALVLGSTERVYLPVRIGSATKDGNVELILKSNVEVREVFITVSRLEGSAGVILRRRAPLRSGPYRLRDGIKVKMPELISPGFYRIDLTVSAVSTGDRPPEYIWIYYGSIGN